MQILLREDDGLFFGGIPRNVILEVTFDDGKKIRVPYSAEKSISALYEDLSSIAPQIKESTLDIPEEVVSPPEDFKHPLNVNKDHSREVSKDRSNVIEREDFVTLTRLDEGRDKGATCDLILGNEYRVLKVYSTGITKPGENKITQIVNAYDVVDDSAARPERTRVFPHEVVLSRKRNTPPPLAPVKIEEILACPVCQDHNVCILEGDTFKGLCESCQNDISIKRLIKKCTGKKCGNEVALFDNGTNFKGICNKCRKFAEVEYDK